MSPIVEGPDFRCSDCIHYGADIGGGLHSIVVVVWTVGPMFCMDKSTVASVWVSSKGAAMGGDLFFGWLHDGCLGERSRVLCNLC